MAVSAPARCSVCTRTHDPTRHAERLAADRKRRKNKRIRVGRSYCSTCRGICKPDYHRQRRAKNNQQKRAWEERNKEHVRSYLRDYKREHYEPQRSTPSIALDFYPYDNADHPLIQQANDIIPKSLPDSVRADACQEFILAMIEGRRPEVEKIIKRSWPSDYQTLSLESTVDEHGRTLEERI